MSLVNEMMKTSKLVFGAALTFAPLTALAQEYDYDAAVTAGVGHYDVSDGGGNFTALTLDSVGTLGFGSGFELGYDGSLAYAFADQGSDVDAQDFGLDLTYTFNQNLQIGGYVDYSNLDLGSFLGSLDTVSYGLLGGIQGQSLGAEFFVGHSETSPNLVFGDESTDYGAIFNFNLGDRARWGAHAMQSEWSGSGADADIWSWGIGGEMELIRGWRAMGGVFQVNASGFDLDTTTYGLGVVYDLNRIGAFPASLSAELYRHDFSSGTSSNQTNAIRLGLTIPLGQSDSATPLNSVADLAMRPRHNVLTSYLDASF